MQLRFPLLTPVLFPRGTRIVDMNNRDITTITTDASLVMAMRAQFKVLYPLESVGRRDRQRAALLPYLDVYQYAVFYALCQ